MRVVREGVGLDYRLRFLHDGAWAHECIVAPHNMDKMITKVWREFGGDEILYENIPLSRVRAIRYPGRKY
jgi:hypothetical protein